MIKIDLHDYYPHCPRGSFEEVSDEVASALKKFEREDTARQVKEFRYKAYYSLDALDGIEEAVLKKPETPQDIFEREATKLLLGEAISKLTETQARRIYAHIILDLSITEIAKMEGKHHSSIAESIKQALSSIEKYFSENLA